jgi:hypothetical protein
VHKMPDKGGDKLGKRPSTTPCLLLADNIHSAGLHNPVTLIFHVPGVWHLATGPAKFLSLSFTNSHTSVKANKVSTYFAYG